MSSSTATTPRIAIIGAGPAGLCLAAILQRSGVSCTIFEGEDSSVARDQGGTLDLHPGSGQAALDAAGLLEDFFKHARPEGEATKLILANGTVLWDDNNSSMDNADLGRGRPEIDRRELRELLLGAVDPASIHWQTKVAGVHADTPQRGQATLELAPASASTAATASASTASTGPYDLVIGADGAWSRGRALLTDVKPSYSGITGVELWARETATRHPWLHEFVGTGSVFMFDEGRAIIAQRQGSGDVRVYAAVRVPEEWKDSCGIDWAAPDARDRLVQAQFSDVAPDLQRIIRDSSDKTVVRALFHLPVDHEWSAHPNVTVLGDAAHLMTPFAGIGVNMALADAKDLADEIVAAAQLDKAPKEPARFASAIKSYEAKMYPRSHQAAARTLQGLQLHFSAKGGPERAAKLQRHAEMRAAAAKEKEVAAA